MKKLIILTLLTVLTGLTMGLETPQPSIIEKADLDMPSYYESSERPDVNPGFETDLTYSYQSDLVDFNTSESVEAQPTRFEDSREAVNNNETGNETAENTTQNETNMEDDGGSSYSSGSGSSDYSTSSIDVEAVDEDNSSVNETDETDETETSSSNSDNQTEKPEQRTQPGLFEGPWTETEDSSESLRERLSAQFSESETVGGITLLVFGGLAAYSYM